MKTPIQELSIQCLKEIKDTLSVYEKDKSKDVFIKFQTMIDKENDQTTIDEFVRVRTDIYDIIKNYTKVINRINFLIPMVEKHLTLYPLKKLSKKVLSYLNEFENIPRFEIIFNFLQPEPNIEHYNLIDELTRVRNDLDIKIDANRFTSNKINSFLYQINKAQPFFKLPQHLRQTILSSYLTKGEQNKARGLCKQFNEDIKTNPYGYVKREYNIYDCKQLYLDPKDKNLIELRGYKKYSKAIALDIHGKIFVCTHYATIEVYDLKLKKSEVIETLNTDHGNVSSIFYDEKTDRIFTVTKDSFCAIWNTITFEKEFEFESSKGKNAILTSIFYHPNDSILIGHSNGNIEHWDDKTKQCISVITEGHTHPIIKMEHFGKKIVTCDCRGNICFWEIKLDNEQKTKLHFLEKDTNLHIPSFPSFGYIHEKSYNFSCIVDKTRQELLLGYQNGEIIAKRLDIDKNTVSEERQISNCLYDSFNELNSFILLPDNKNLLLSIKDNYHPCSIIQFYDIDLTDQKQDECRFRISYEILFWFGLGFDGQIVIVSRGYHSGLRIAEKEIKNDHPRVSDYLLNNNNNTFFSETSNVPYHDKQKQPQIENHEDKVSLKK